MRHNLKTWDGFWSLLWICFFLLSQILVHWQNYVLIVCELVLFVSWTWMWGQKDECGFVSRPVHVIFSTFSLGLDLLHGHIHLNPVLSGTPEKGSHKDILIVVTLSSLGLESLTFPRHWHWLILVAAVLRFGYHCLDYLIDYPDSAMFTPDYSYLLLSSISVMRRPGLLFS